MPLKTPEKSVKKTSWGRRIFWALNIIGAIILIPLMIEVAPLVGIWWNTLNVSNYARSQSSDGNDKSEPALIEDSSGQFTDPSESTTTPSAENGLDAARVNQLSGRVEAIENLAESEIEKIVAFKFGNKVAPKTDPEQFDQDSAVFDTITKSMETIEGRVYHCYHIDLVDQHGNHRIQMDCYEDTNLGLERSMQTMQLVNGNPQLKKIYDAASHFFGSESAEPSTDSETSDDTPVLRLEPGQLPN